MVHRRTGHERPAWTAAAHDARPDRRHRAGRRRQLPGTRPGLRREHDRQCGLLRLRDRRSPRILVRRLARRTRSVRGGGTARRPDRAPFPDASRPDAVVRAPRRNRLCSGCVDRHSGLRPSVRGREPLRPHRPARNRPRCAERRLPGAGGPRPHHHRADPDHHRHPLRQPLRRRRRQQGRTAGALGRSHDDRSVSRSRGRTARATETSPAARRGGPGCRDHGRDRPGAGRRPWVRPIVRK